MQTPAIDPLCRLRETRGGMLIHWGMSVDALWRLRAIWFYRHTRPKAGP
jgi:hypothetical protein